MKSALSQRRVLFALLVCTAAAASMLSGTLLAFFGPEASRKVSQRTLTFVERVTYQRAIEEVYWRHRIWPKQRPDPKPSLDAVMSKAQLEKKVADDLRNSQALEDYWRRPITADQLQVEMERMASHTKQPGVLREIFAALGNDPFVIAECLARPVLAERLITELYAHDQRFHEELKRRTEAELQGHPSIEQMKLLSGDYSEIELVRSDSVQEQADHSHEHSLKLHSHEWDKTVQTFVAVRANYTLRVIASPLGGCTRPWTATSTTNAPDARFAHTAVWTGSEMIVWGGAIFGPTFFNTGGRYNPSTDSWTATSTTNAPAARVGHTAVWTGSEMIVWGGYSADYFNTGGRYNPSTDSWTATSTTNAPAATTGHTAVWTGSEMIIWGGNFGGQTGGRYNPGTDSWTATSTTNAPDGRSVHTAVWTGSEMIVWGGFGGFEVLNTGGRYNPGTDSWTATSTTNAPDARFSHTAVWTGSEMIVWGGEIFGPTFFNTGGRYSPRTDRWMATSTTNAPDARDGHTAVWTGSEMIVWGGYDGVNYFNTGGRINPSIDGWAATTTNNAPAPRYGHTAAWTGNQMIVWGGSGFGNIFDTGGRYCPALDRPTPTPRPRPTPHPRL